MPTVDIKHLFSSPAERVGMRLLYSYVNGIVPDKMFLLTGQRGGIPPKSTHTRSVMSDILYLLKSFQFTELHIVKLASETGCIDKPC